MLFLVQISLLINLCSSSVLDNWGFFSHKRINRMAVFTIPDDELFQFYKFHIDFITEHAVDPDKRRYAVDGESVKHYIDIDHYVDPGVDPFTVMPRDWNDAVNKFTEDTLKTYGIVPWHVSWMVKRLTNAFREKSLDKILRYSSDIGHYIGDAHVPLHTTENYNGQFTNQKGIHAFWESRVPELMAENYDYLVGKAVYVNSPLTKMWNVVEHSFRAVDSVLSFEKKLSEEWPEDKKYAIENRGQVSMKVYSREFTEEYARRLNGMQNRRMRESILTVGSFWYTAWIDAGQPDLRELANGVSDEYQKEINEINQKSRANKIKGREHGK